MKQFIKTQDGIYTNIDNITEISTDCRNLKDNEGITIVDEDGCAVEGYVYMVTITALEETKYITKEQYEELLELER